MSEEIKKLKFIDTSKCVKQKKVHKACPYSIQCFMHSPEILEQFDRKVCDVHGYLLWFYLNDKPIYASNKTIGRKIGYSESSVKHALVKLEHAGVIYRDLSSDEAKKYKTGRLIKLQPGLIKPEAKRFMKRMKSGQYLAEPSRKTNAPRSKNTHHPGQFPATSNKGNNKRNDRESNKEVSEDFENMKSEISDYFLKITSGYDISTDQVQNILVPSFIDKKITPANQNIPEQWQTGADAYWEYWKKNSEQFDGKPIKLRDFANENFAELYKLYSERIDKIIIYDQNNKPFECNVKHKMIEMPTGIRQLNGHLKQYIDYRDTGVKVRLKGRDDYINFFDLPLNSKVA